MNLDSLQQVGVCKNERFDEQKLIISLSNWAATASGRNIWAYCATYCSSVYRAGFPNGNERFVVLCGFVTGV